MKDKVDALLYDFIYIKTWLFRKDKVSASVSNSVN